MLDNFVLPILSQWDSHEELHVKQDGAQPHFALPLREWLDSHFTICGLGVEDKYNDIREEQILYNVISFCAVEPKRKSVDQNQKHLVNRHDKFQRLCCCSSCLLIETC
jgi:hypothetical protein